MTYNFEIGGLGFNKYVSNDHPYERATAPFRKEQFDSAPTVGDQSLTGWWTRGQLSFHKGAGVEYYEVLDGEGVLSRYRDSEGVDVSSPGEASLYSEWVSLAESTTNVQQASGAVGSVAWTTTSGQVKTAVGTNPVTTHLTPSGNPASGPLVMTGQYIFLITATAGADTTIERIRVSTVGAASATLYTHSLDLKDIFYAKGRLWVVDSAGDWFHLAAEPSAPPLAIGTADKIFSSGEALGLSAPGGLWGFAATPGPVYFARNNTIYAATVDADGTVPTLTAPMVAAELPAGGEATGLHYYLGHLVISTTSGVRVATIDPNGGLVYGPVLVEWDMTAAGMTAGAVKNTVYVYGQHETYSDPPTVYAIDLSNPIDSGLRFPVSRLPGALPAVFGTGGVVASASRIYWWANGAGIKTATAPTVVSLTAQTLAASGYLTTGFHRFGTLDGKHFQSVTLRVGGDGGSIAVYRVDADETETLLGRVTPAESSGSFSLGLNSPVERVALKFVLTRDATDPTLGPILLGYQLKALPAPVRQRLVRIPLMLFDVERPKNGRPTGRKGDAWVRLQALESLETTDALVEFTDRDTGETGTALIESVEVNMTAASDFGGVVNLTLRKV